MIALRLMTIAQLLRKRESLLEAFAFVHGASRTVVQLLALSYQFLRLADQLAGVQVGHCESFF